MFCIQFPQNSFNALALSNSNSPRWYNTKRTLSFHLAMIYYIMSVVVDRFLLSFISLLSRKLMSVCSMFILNKGYKNKIIHLVGTFTDLFIKLKSNIYIFLRDRRGRDRMVVGFRTTYAISTYHH